MHVTPVVTNHHLFSVGIALDIYLLCRVGFGPFLRIISDVYLPYSNPTSYTSIFKQCMSFHYHSPLTERSKFAEN